MKVQNPSKSSQTRWIWPFELLEQIGEGGMGVVYRARYVVNDRNVALKMVPSDVTDKTVLARFEREVEVLKTLKHPNIVRCFGGSCENKRRFYAMELVEGGSLEDQLQSKGKLPWEQVVYYGLQMCAALDCSHEKGVVHRDIKPGNFLLTQQGQLKLADFGLASVAAARKITAAGKTAGTFLYMAPEQIRGREVTPQTDLYAMGCVLYELVTGEPPFVGETSAATLHMHCNATPRRPTELSLDCPVSLERIILELLNKEQAQRPSSAAELAKRLRSVNQKVTVVEKRKPNILGQTPRDSDIKPPESTPKHGAPFWLTASLATALVVSLIFNAMSYSDKPSGQADQLWVTASTSSHIHLREEASLALGKISAGNPSCVTALIHRLEDQEPSVRRAAAIGLQKSGVNGKPAIATLVKVQKHDEDRSVRDAALKAINAIKLTKPKSFPWIGAIIATVLVLGTLAGLWRWYDAVSKSETPNSEALV